MEAVMTPWLTLALLGHALATEAPTLIDQDTTWTAADGPWEVLETVTISQGATLVIEPGVTVELAEDAGITVLGALWAVGEDGAPIVFTRPGDAEGAGSWGPIHFTESSTDASYEQVNSLVEGSALVHCELRYGARAVLIEGASPLIRSCSFEHNSFEPESSESDGGAAIRILAGSRARVEASVFLDNTVGGWGYGGAIEVLEADPVILGNHFEGNISVYGGAVCLQNSQGPILGNSFVGNEVGGEGGAVSLYSSAGAFVDNTITGNESLFDGGGVHVCVDCKPHAAPWVVDNVITDNVSRAIGAGGLGAAWIRGLMFNDIHGNLRADEPADLLWANEELEAYPAWVHSPAIPHNWWGTTDPDAIEETITDGEDEDGFGVVDWQPPADGPVAAPTPRALITTPMLRYDQAEQVMTANLVLYNPGLDRELELRLFVRIDEAWLVPYTADLGVPELEASGDTWIVSMPADSAIFATIAAPTRGSQDLPPTAAWVATLHDASTGELIGEALETPVALQSGGAR
jgi:hypothetical protein